MRYVFNYASSDLRPKFRPEPQWLIFVFASSEGSDETVGMRSLVLA